MTDVTGAEGEGGRRVQYRHLCGGPCTVQALLDSAMSGALPLVAPWGICVVGFEDAGRLIPAECGGTRPIRSGPRPSVASRSRRRGSSASARSFLRKECNSSDDSSTKREARAFMVRDCR